MTETGDETKHLAVNDSDVPAIATLMRDYCEFWFWVSVKRPSFGRLTTRLIACFLIRYIFRKVVVMLIFIIGHKNVLEIRRMRIAPARGMRAQRFRDWIGDGNTGIIGYSMGLCDTSQSFSACKVSLFAVLPDHRRETSKPKVTSLTKMRVFTVYKNQKYMLHIQLPISID